jgi:hypothetical protein
MSSPNQALLQVMHGSRHRIARVCFSVYPLAHYIMDTAQALRPATLALPLPHTSLPWPLALMHHGDGGEGDLTRSQQTPGCSFAGIEWSSEGGYLQPQT